MTFQQALLRKGIKFRTSRGDIQKTHICCPFCISRGKGEDNQFRLCVHATGQWGRCMHCDWKSRHAIGPVLKQLGIVADVKGSEPEEQAVIEPVELPKDFIRLTRVYDDLDRKALDYIRGRGVTEEQIRNHKIGVSYIGRYAYRIIFPIYIDKILKFINARDFTGLQTPKYLNSKGDKYLFNFDPKNPTCILSEGAIKALRIHQAIPSVCSASLLGHDLTENQFSQIEESKCKEIILFPDLDLAGRKGIIGIAEKLKERWKKKIRVVWPVQSPADETPIEDLKTLYQNHVVAYTWKLRSKILL